MKPYGEREPFVHGYCCRCCLNRIGMRKRHRKPSKGRERWRGKREIERETKEKP